MKCHQIHRIASFACHWPCIVLVLVLVLVDTYNCRGCESRLYLDMSPWTRSGCRTGPPAGGRSLSWWRRSGLELQLEPTRVELLGTVWVS